MDKKEAERAALENEKETQQEQEQEQVVNPWEVSAKEGGKIDYDKLIDKFGCQRLDQSLIDRVERLTSRRAHVFLRRGVFFAHRYRYHSILTFLYVNICMY
jgi:tryptophanyl-tRNA synthetase